MSGQKNDTKEYWQAKIDAFPPQLKADLEKHRADMQELLKCTDSEEEKLEIGKDFIKKACYMISLHTGDFTHSRLGAWACGGQTAHDITGVKRGRAQKLRKQQRKAEFSRFESMKEVAQSVSDRFKDEEKFRQLIMKVMTVDAEAEYVDKEKKEIELERADIAKLKNELQTGLGKLNERLNEKLNSQDRRFQSSVDTKELRAAISALHNRHEEDLTCGRNDERITKAYTTLIKIKDMLFQ